MKSVQVFFLCLAAVIAASCGGSSDDSSGTPTVPSSSTITTAQATSTAENVGTLTLSAIQSASASIGIQRVAHAQTMGPLAAAGATFGTAACAGGGQVIVTYLRDYTPSGGEVDLSALKVTFSACSFTSSGSSFQIGGDLTLTGKYYGSTRSPEITVSGSLTTTGGTCTMSGRVSATGAYSGSACGTTVTTTPPAPPVPAEPTVTLTGTWTGNWTTFEPRSSPACGRDENSARLVLTQSGNSVSGTIIWTITSSYFPGDVGKTNTQPITGTVNGSAVTFTMGPYTGTGTFTATSLTGSFISTEGNICQPMPFTTSRQ